MYEQVTPESLAAKVAGRVSENMLTGEGSYFELHTKPLLMEVAEGYHELDALHPKLFPGPSDGSYIDDAAAVDGIYRKPGVQAVLAVRLVGRAEMTVAAGTRFSDRGLYYSLQDAVTLDADGQGTGAVICETAGTAGNLSEGTVLRSVVSISGLTSVTIGEIGVRGADEESDAALHARWYAHLQQPASSGNTYQVEQWATEIAGIGHAKCIPVPDGPGTVGVILATEDYQSPDPVTIQKCLDHIFAEFPAAGIRISVEGVATVEVDIAATVKLTGSNLEAVQAAFEASVTAYLQSLAFRTGGEIVYYEIVQAIMNVDGVYDVTALTVNGGTENVQLPDYASAVPHSVEVVSA